MTHPDPGARPVGAAIDWTPAPRPDGPVLEGRYALLEPMRADRHAAPIFEAMQGHDWVWDYIGYGPFPTAEDYAAWMRGAETRPDPHFLAIRDLESGRWGGVAAFMRIVPEMGVIEVGSITWAPALQRTRAATEAMFLMMQWAFDHGYRRYEWKCDHLNAPSRRAAQRLGFSYEGIFRQHMIYKGRTRDTAWFAVTDRDWPALKAAFETWLDPSNFDAEGRQKQRLSDLTGGARVARDPGV